MFNQNFNSYYLEMANEYTKAVLYGIQNFNDKVKEKAKKEIGMMKLLELLNEYEPGNLPITKISGQGIDLVISKRYGFIKWLVDNDKIAYDIPNNSDLYRAFELACISLDNADYITMLLAIQDSPIDFLCSILKDKKIRTVYVDEDGNVSGDTKRYSDC